MPLLHLFAQVPDWLASSIPEGGRVGIDPFLHTIENAEKLDRVLRAAGRELVPLPSNPVDGVWGEDRPAPSSAPLRAHALEWAGRSVAEKLGDMRQQLKEESAGAMLVTMLGAPGTLSSLSGLAGLEVESYVTGSSSLSLRVVMCMQAPGSRGRCVPDCDLVAEAPRCFRIEAPKMHSPLLCLPPSASCASSCKEGRGLSRCGDLPQMRWLGC